MARTYCPVFVVQLEVRPDRACSLHEELKSSRRLNRRQGHGLLAVDVQKYAARGQYRYAGGANEGADLACRGNDLFDIVQYEQHATAGECRGDLLS